MLLICGSLQATSANRRALDVIAGRLAELGAVVEDSVALGGVPAFDPGRAPGRVVDALRQRVAGSIAVVIAHVVDELAIAAPRTKTDDDGRYTEQGTVVALRRVAEIVRAAPDLSGADRLRLVRDVTARIGIGLEHIAPLI